MKIRRVILPLLMAMFLLIPGMSSHAEARVVKFSAGAETGKITIRVWDLQTLEGVVKVKALDGGEIHLESVTIATDDPANTEICEASGNKVFMVSNGALIKSTITVNLSFVEDGTYLVTLSGGCTDKNGKYSANGLNEKQEILVGAANVDEDEEDEDETTAETSTADTASPQEITNTENSTETVTTTVTASDETEEGTTITRNPNGLTVDDADMEALKELAEEAEKEIEKQKSTLKQSGSKLFNILKIVVPLLLLIALAVGGYFYWRFRKKQARDYDGAPMVDYDIDEDDIEDEEVYDDEDEDDDEDDDEE